MWNYLFFNLIVMALEAPKWIDSWMDRMEEKVKKPLENLKKEVKGNEVKDTMNQRKFDELCDKERLTDLEVKQIVEYVNKNSKYLELDNLKVITDTQAEMLSGVEELYLKWLKSITDRQARSLSKVKEFLDLSWLRKISDEQAKSLAKTDAFLLIDEDILTSSQKQILQDSLVRE